MALCVNIHANEAGIKMYSKLSIISIFLLAGASAVASELMVEADGISVKNQTGATTLSINESGRVVFEGSGNGFIGSGTTQRIDMGFGGTGGGNLETYGKDHTVAPGRFSFVYGGYPGIGEIVFVHWDGTRWQTKMALEANGNFGIGQRNPAHPLHMASGAHVTSGGTWVNASSRLYKENIRTLSLEDAIQAVTELNPVVYNYTKEKDEDYLGFIAEDVPNLVATSDRKGLSAMDMVAVLTKVVQYQQQQLEEIKLELNALKK
jgi:hypothetical protein